MRVRQGTGRADSTALAKTGHAMMGLDQLMGFQPLAGGLVAVGAGASAVGEERTSLDQELVAWVEAHTDFLLRVATRLCGVRAVAEELVQEAFLIAHRRRSDLPPDLNVRAWLYRVLSNLVRHHHRSIARRLRLQQALSREEDLGSGQQPSPHEELERRERAQQVRACVAKLPHKQREVFTLFELEGLEGAEIARLLEIPENTVWSRLRHARLRFREHWERAERQGRRT